MVLSDRPAVVLLWLYSSSRAVLHCQSISAWEQGQAKCLKGGLPSTSSPVANHALPKTKKRKSCIQGWCVYEGKYCMQSAVSPPLQHNQGIVDLESAVRYSWILHADISGRNYDSLLQLYNIILTNKCYIDITLSITITWVKMVRLDDLLGNTNPCIYITLMSPSAGLLLQWWESFHGWFNYQQLSCASCHAWQDQDQVQIHQWHLLTQRQMSSCQVVSSTAVTFIYRNAVRWGLLVISFKKAPVFCFCPLLPFRECTLNSTTSLSDEWRSEKGKKW